MLTTLLVLLWSAGVATPNVTKINAALLNLNAPVAEKRVLGLRQLAALPADVQALKPLLAALRDPVPAVRLQALITWGKVGRHYDDAEWKERRNAATTIYDGDILGYGEKTRRAWLQQLLDGFKRDAQDADVHVRRAALRNLTLLCAGVETVMPPMPRCGTGFEETLDFNAQSCLFEIAAANSDLLFGLMRDKNPNVVYNVIEALPADNAKVQISLRRMLTDKHPEWRAVGISGLGRSGLNADFFTRLLPLLGDPDARVCRSAIYYFSLMQNNIEGGSPTVMNRLLADKYVRADSVVRGSILQIYGDAGDHLATFALQDPDGEVRAQAIGRLTDSSEARLSEAYLVQQLKHPHPRVREEASRVLWRRQEKDDYVGIPVAPIESDKLPPPVSESGEVLDTDAQDTRHPKEIPPFELLLPLLNDSDGEVRDTQIAYASNYTDARITEPLLQALRRSRNEGGRMSGYVARHLESLGAEAAPLVRQMLHDDSPQIRFAAVSAATKLLPLEASSLLVTALQDKLPAIREKSAQLLEYYKDEAAENALIVLLHDKDANVRHAVAWTLGKTGSEQALRELSALPVDTDESVDEAILQAMHDLKNPS